jgi:predicted acyl esterase
MVRRETPSVSTKLVSHLLQRLLKLDPPPTRNVVVEHDLRVPMADGVELLADRWAPRSGGDGRAFPRYARNTGTGEPHVTATALVAADQAVHHDATYPSAVILPVVADPRSR